MRPRATYLNMTHICTRGNSRASLWPARFVYFLLRIFGLTYLKNYLLTSALVTFFTASLVLAVSASAVFKIARELAADREALFWPAGAALIYALATTTFSYSGIAHHDALATGYLVIAFYFIFQLSRRQVEQHAYLKSCAAGLLLGLTITTSMFAVLHGHPLLALLSIAAALGPVTIFLIGLLAGCCRSSSYDAVSFGNALRLANIAGASMFADTFWRFERGILVTSWPFIHARWFLCARVCSLRCLECLTTQVGSNALRIF